MSLPSPQPSAPRKPLDTWLLLPVLLCLLCAGIIAALGINEGAFKTLNAAAAGWLPAFAWAGITNMGNALGAISLLALTLAKWPRWMAAALLAAPFASLFTHSIKWLADQPRPAAVLASEPIHIIGATLRANSFPSGHSLTIFLLAGVVVLGSRCHWAWLAVLLAALVAFSRIAVGAHWPLDLLAGAAGGWVSAALGCALSERWRFWERARGQRILAGIALLASAAFCFENTGYPEGVWIQILLGSLGIAGALYALWRPAALPHRAAAAA